MKKLFTILSLSALVVGGVSAQRVAGGALFSMENPLKTTSSSMDKAPFDTLTPPVRTGCSGDSIFVLGALDENDEYAGFITGTNGFGDKEKAQSFTNASPGKVIAAFGAVGFKSGAGSYSAKVYGLSGGLPSGAALGTSAPGAYPAASVVVFVFGTPVSVPASDFVVSVPVTGAPGDTIALASSRFGCGNLQSFELWSDDTWHTIDDAWGADLDIQLGVIVDRAVTFGISEANMPSAGIAPNPAVDFTMIGYNTKENGNVVIKVTNLAGQTVMLLNEGAKQAGTYTRIVDVNPLAAGTYLYEVSCNGKAVTGRLVVAK